MTKRCCTICSMVLLLFLSCHSRQHDVDNRPKWDSITSTYHIPDASLEIVFDDENESWQVADPMRLPENVEFCAVNDSTGACAMMIVPEISSTINRVADLSYVDVDKILEDVISQNEGILSKRSAPVVSNGKVNDHDYLKITSSVLIGVDGENEPLSVSFIGYLFDCNGKIRGLILTSLTEILETVGEEDMFKSLYSKIKIV